MNWKLSAAPLGGIGLIVAPCAPASAAVTSKNLGPIWFIGDSITQSNADGDPNGSPRKALYDQLNAAGGYTFSYTGHWTANEDGLPATGGTPSTNLYQYHSGVSGAVIGNDFAGRTGITQNIPGWWTSGRLATDKPNAILIDIGTNDVDNNVDLPNAPARVTALVDAIFAQPGVGNPSIFIGTIAPNRTNTPQDPDNTAAFNAALPGVVSGLRSAGRDAYFVDLFAPLDANYATAMNGDNLHPNAAGNTIIAQQFFNAIEARAVPEPGTAALAATALSGLLLRRRRRIGPSK